MARVDRPAGAEAGRRYDYVVVGAGSAGCVIAGRLSADPGIRVLLIEAGPRDWHPFLHMPAAFAYTIGARRFDWRFTSEAEPGLDGRRIPCPRGRVLGGSSAINAMAFVRGQPADFDGWAAQGLPSWSFAACLPYFRRLESYSGGGDAWRGADGPVRVTRPAYSTPLNERFLAACAQAGHDLLDDPNGPVQEGFGPMDQTIRDGARESAATAYLRPARRRPNLTVLTGCRALRLVLEGRVARGVRLAHRGRRFDVQAEREVILSAGAIGSPHLLMLSGIGPADALRRAGIAAIHDLPGVGANLQDHVDVSLKQACPEPVTMSPALRHRQKLPILLRWLIQRAGAGATSHFEVAGYVRSDESVDRPDVQICFIPLLARYDGGAMGAGHGYQATIMALRPESRGRLEPRSDDPAVPPQLLFNYLDHPADLAPLRAGIRHLRRILAQPAFDGLRGPELQPGEAVRSDADLERFIRATAKSTHHPCGTCRMGHDPMAVVDDQGRVRGMDGLRVVDASIMPTITSGNINAPTLMLAEKLADLIGAG